MSQIHGGGVVVLPSEGEELASHGLLSCRRCWGENSSSIQERGPFRLVRDAGHWGSSNPHTLVLGISKGNTQSQALRDGPFESVAFKGIRHRILQGFQSVGLLPNEAPADFERRFGAGESDFAFASVVRCSLTGMDRKKGCHTADSPNVIPAFKLNSDGSGFVENCVDEHLVRLPPRTRLVLLLGNTGSYISALADLIARKRGPTSFINPVAYDSRQVRFIHLAHPSKGNGHFGAFVRGEGTAGQKRDWARDALTFEGSGSAER